MRSSGRWRSISPVLQEYSNLHNAGRRVHGKTGNPGQTRLYMEEK
jgi:hypothetical protein